MKELGISKRVGNSDLYITIREINLNKEIACAANCWQIRNNGKGCAMIKDLQQSLSHTNTFHATEVVVEVYQMRDTEVTWSIGREDIVLIDSEGFQVEGYIMCNQLTKYRESKEYFVILPGTRAVYRQLFPILPEGITVSKLAVKGHLGYAYFAMSD